MLILVEKARNGRINFKNRFYTLARFPRGATQFFDCQVVKLILPPLRVVRREVVLVVKWTVVATVVEIYAHGIITWRPWSRQCRSSQLCSMLPFSTSLSVQGHSAPKRKHAHFTIFEGQNTSAHSFPQFAIITDTLAKGI